MTEMFRRGETYRYRIRCFRRVDGVMYLGPITETNAYTVSLDVPVITNLQYNSEKTRLQVQWKKISGADWYEILQKDSGGWKRIAVSEDNNYELETDTGKKIYIGYSGCNESKWEKDVQPDRGKWSDCA